MSWTKILKKRDMATIGLNVHIWECLSSSGIEQCTFSSDSVYALQSWSKSHDNQLSTLNLRFQPRIGDYVLCDDSACLGYGLYFSTFSNQT